MSGVGPPIVPVKVVAPAVFTVRVWAPLTVLPRVIAAAGAGHGRIGPEGDGIIIGLVAGGGDGAAVEIGRAAGIGREARERIGGADGARKGRGAGAVGREAERIAGGAVERLAKGDVPCPRIQRGIHTEFHGIIIGLVAGGGDGAAVEIGRAARIGREARERIGGADGARKGRGAGAVAARLNVLPAVLLTSCQR